MAEEKKVAPKAPAAAKPAAKPEVKAAPAKVAAPVAAKPEAKPAPAVKPAAPKAAAPVAAKPAAAPAPKAEVKPAPVAEKTTVKPVAPAVNKPATVAVKNKAAKSKVGQYIATGRRKKSVARVRLYANGKGLITINDKNIDQYFVSEVLKLIVRQPLTLVKVVNQYDVIVNVYGGGDSGQAGAIRQAIARALVEQNPTMKAELKAAGYLTRDSRMKERKKYGLKKARKAPQFSKR